MESGEFLLVSFTFIKLSVKSERKNWKTEEDMGRLMVFPQSTEYHVCVDEKSEAEINSCGEKGMLQSYSKCS